MPCIRVARCSAAVVSTEGGTTPCRASVVAISRSWWSCLIWRAHSVCSVWFGCYGWPSAHIWNVKSLCPEKLTFMVNYVSKQWLSVVAVKCLQIIYAWITIPMKNNWSRHCRRWLKRNNAALATPARRSPPPPEVATQMRDVDVPTIAISSATLWSPMSQTTAFITVLPKPVSRWGAHLEVQLILRQWECHYTVTGLMLPLCRYTLYNNNCITFLKQESLKLFQI